MDTFIARSLTSPALVHHDHRFRVVASEFRRLRCNAAAHMRLRLELHLMALTEVSLKQTVIAAMNSHKFNIPDSHFQVQTVGRCRMMRDRWPPRVEIDGPLFFSETMLAGQASLRRRRASGDPGGPRPSSKCLLPSPHLHHKNFQLISLLPQISVQYRRRRK